MAPAWRQRNLWQSKEPGLERGKATSESQDISTVADTSSLRRRHGQDDPAAQDQRDSVDPYEREASTRTSRRVEAGSSDNPIDEVQLDANDVTEFRDGFFDALYLNPHPVKLDDLAGSTVSGPPASAQKKPSLSSREFIPGQWHEVKSVVRKVVTTRAGIQLMKSFLSFFIAYVLCLIPITRDWLGRPTCYIITVSAIVNHPGRTLGAQLDGAVLTVLGVASGLGWGAFGLWLSTLTIAAQAGYGGVLAMFLCLYMAAVALLRSYYIRLYQLALCAGIAALYTCLTDVSGSPVAWVKLSRFGIPWSIGQAISLAINAMIFPDGGARPLAAALHEAAQTILDGLSIPRQEQTTHRLARCFVDLSQAYRDLAMDISITPFHPRDVLSLRNLLQGVIKTLIALKIDGRLFGGNKIVSAEELASDLATEHISELNPVPSTADAPCSTPANIATQTEDQAVQIVRQHLEEPSNCLLRSMKATLRCCDAALMDMSSYRQSLGPSMNISSDTATPLIVLRQHMMRFDTAESTLLDGDDISTANLDLPEVIKILAFCLPMRQAAGAVEALAVKVNQMQQQASHFPRVCLPSYPLYKAIIRNNAQVRHDRGGVTAGSYYRTFSDISSIIQELKSRSYTPLPDDPYLREEFIPPRMSHVIDPVDDPSMKSHGFRYQLWKLVHQLQGFETRYALKTVLVTSLLSVPAWLPQSHDWWNQTDAWWAVVMAWFMMHPRVGGNFQDLVTRSALAGLGALWSGLAFAAGNGNPWVMAVFAAVYMLPMMYRFTQSAHPRSGVVGCLSFTVISLSLVNSDDAAPVATMAATRGLAFIVGVVAAILINWMLWPFVARHELRKAVSNMLFFLSIIYRGVVAKYVYYEKGHDPSSEDIRRSEILEGRLREGFVRIRELMDLTRHEIRLRAPFEPRPYVALTESCEAFFENLVAVRHASLFFHPLFIRDGNSEAAERLLCYRRDAVAAILSGLYILAVALRSNRKVPKYLPNAAAARKRLLDKMSALELELASDPSQQARADQRRKWWQVYSYSYNESLTGCAAQLEQLEAYTKLIVGEQDLYVDDERESDSEGEND